jgi:hypothetical protein
MKMNREREKEKERKDMRPREKRLRLKEERKKERERKREKEQRRMVTVCEMEAPLGLFVSEVFEHLEHLLKVQALFGRDDVDGPIDSIRLKLAHRQREILGRV